MKDEDWMPEEERAKRAAFRDAISRAPEEDFYGMVAPNGSFWDNKKEGFAMNFQLACWKRNNGELEAARCGIYVELPPKSSPEFEAQKSLSADSDISEIFAVSMQAMAVMKDGVAPYSIVHVRGRLARHPDGFWFCAASSLVSRDHRDPELEAMAAKLRSEGISVDDPTFGTLKLHPGALWYDSEPRWRKRKICLELEHGNDFLPLPASLETARALWGDQEAWGERIVDFAVARFMELYATRWREDAKKLKKPVDASQVREKLKLETVRVDAAGKFTFCFESGRVFQEHCIWVSGDLTNGPTESREG